MKKLLFGSILAAVFALSASAQVWVSGTLAAGTNTIVANSSAALLSLQITDTSGSANTIRVYDTATGLTNTVTPAYITRSLSTSTETQVFTNMVGVLQTNTFSKISTAYTTNSAATNEARRVYVITVPANGTVVLAPDSALGFSYGISPWATAAATYNAQYRTLP